MPREFTYKAVGHSEKPDEPPLFNEEVTVEILDDSLSYEEARFQAEAELGSQVIERYERILLETSYIDFLLIEPSGTPSSFSISEFRERWKNCP